MIVFPMLKALLGYTYTLQAKLNKTKTTTSLILALRLVRKTNGYPYNVVGAPRAEVQKHVGSKEHQEHVGVQGRAVGRSLSKMKALDKRSDELMRLERQGKMRFCSALATILL